jgi:hypothetical protein
MSKEDAMTDDFQNILRRVVAAQPKIYLSGHEGYYRHADIARLLLALTAWNTRPDTEKLKEAITVLTRMRENRAGTNNTAIATERRALDTVLAAITKDPTP